MDEVGLTCPRCDAPVAADARFCANCGQALTPDSGDDGVQARQERIAAAAPPTLIEKMRTAKLTGERKPVTALFADIVGSTTLAEQMDEEDWTQIVNEAFDLMSKAVYRYEGTIAQLQGDAMLAFFGAPVAHEDDPDRAIRAALDMVSEVAEFARQLKVSHGIEFQIRAGINTGPVIVGNVGSDLRYEYTALGDAVNVAARVQTSAAPGTVVVASDTKRFVTDAFDFDDLGEVELKGKTEPVQLFRVVGVKAQPGRRRGLESVGLEQPDGGSVGRARHPARAVRGRQRRPGPGGRIDRRAGHRQVATARRAASRVAGSEPRSRPGSKAHTRQLRTGRAVPPGAGHGSLDDRHLRRGQRGGGAPDPRQSTRSAAWRRSERRRPIPGAPACRCRSAPRESDRVQIEPDVLQGRYVSAIHRVIRAVARARPDRHRVRGHPLGGSRIGRGDHSAGAAPLASAGAADPREPGETDVPGWRLVTSLQSTIGAALTEVRLQPLSDAD